jgi:hypothetical protein
MGLFSALISASFHAEIYAQRKRTRGYEAVEPAWRLTNYNRFKLRPSILESCWSLPQSPFSGAPQKVRYVQVVNI